MTDLPHGAVTFLFTDIEGSTKLVKTLRDSYADVIAEHQRLIREAIGKHGGHEIDSQGDSFFAVFASATNAVRCALDAQRALAGYPWPGDIRVNVRMGVHTGNATPSSGRYTGLAVHRAARICAAAHGGQVLISQATLTIVEDEEEDLGISLLDLGDQRLKDLDRPVHVYQLTARGLDDAFPRLRTEAPAASELARPTNGGSFVVGRSDELASVQSFLSGIQQGPTALVLAGEPGIGKTVIWEACVREAEERFGRVLLHRGLEAEATLSFAGLSDLLESVFDEIAGLVPLPRRRALEVALLLVEPGDRAIDPRAIGLAVLDVLRLLAERGPVVVAVDDVQWIDGPSAGVLQMAFRRLRSEQVGFLATLREAPDVMMPFELQRSFPEDRLRQLSLGPLDLSALYHLLKDRVGLELTRPELTRVQEAAGGNSFFALEFGRELERQGAKLEAGKPLPVSGSLAKLLAARLARLSPESRSVLLTAAIAARPTVDVMAEAHNDREHVLTALDAAARDGVVQLDGPRIRFAHPLLASVCYEEASPSDRRAAHRAIAAAVTDVEERARHLALAADGPDAATASDLETAAEQAAARGATAAAAELCELAAGLTADPALARRRRLRAAHFDRLAGDAERAVAILDDLLVDAPPGPERADIFLALASTFKAGSRTPISLCTQALAEAAGDDRRTARILAFRSWNRQLDADVKGSLADARSALESAERVGDPELLAVAIQQLGRAETWAGAITPGNLERGVEIEEEHRLAFESLHSPRFAYARWLLHVGELDRVREIAEDIDAQAAARGDESSRVHNGWILGILEWLAGRWPFALELTTARWELADQIQNPHSRGWVGRAKALIEIDLGLVEQARATIEETFDSADPLPRVLALGLQGRLELALGNLEGAGQLLREAPARLLEWGLADPTLTIWADSIETLAALGELDRARVYTESYEGNAARLGSTWAVAGAARCRGLLATAERDLDAAHAAFGRALATLENSPFEFERGRTLLCRGATHRRGQQKRAARDDLEQALAIFDELGARLWADKARDELKRISGRAPGAEGLTETEGLVSSLAAQGRTNKEIAAELYMGVSTVEAHLSRAYRKLGIRSRSALAARLRALDPVVDDIH
jgi:class 3 adenylate cyclase/DNA-binding CsgD family transcriptional regulator